MFKSEVLAPVFMSTENCDIWSVETCNGFSWWETY